MKVPDDLNERIIDLLQEPNVPGTSFAEELAAQELASLLLQHSPPIAPRGAVKEQLFERLPTTTNQQAKVVRPTQRRWKQSPIPGLQTMLLNLDRAAQQMTLYFRCDPGASIPEHDHHGYEQILLLEGDLCQEDQLFGPGDYICSRPGSHHERLWTETGCVLLIVMPVSDSLIA